MGRDVGAIRFLFEMAVKFDAHVDACTHECAAHDTAYDGALEAEPRLLKQTRNFLLHKRAADKQTFQASAVRRCDACAAHFDTGGGLRGNLPRVTKSAQSHPISDALVSQMIKAARLGRM
jgi:hypothetical protein